MRFIVPYSYGFTTRARGILDKISFFVIFFIPEAIICYNRTKLHFFQFVLAFTALYCMYEIGYLQNDICTASREKRPTIRLPKVLYCDVKMHIKPLITIRIICGILCIYVLKLTEIREVLKFTILLGIVSLFFFIHNLIRSKLNILTYFMLCSIKYLALPILFKEVNFAIIILIVLLFPFPRSIEHASKCKYDIGILTNLNHDLFRVSYYAILSSALCGAWMFYAEISTFTLLSIWFFTYRVYALIFRKYRNYFSLLLACKKKGCI